MAFTNRRYILVVVLLRFILSCFGRSISHALFVAADNMNQEDSDDRLQSWGAVVSIVNPRSLFFAFAFYLLHTAEAHAIHVMKMSQISGEIRRFGGIEPT